METRGASVNFQRVTAPAHAVAHNRRGIAPPTYLLPEQFRLGTIEVIDDRGAVSKAFTDKMALASARSRKDQTYSPIWEGVVNLASPSGDLDEYRDAQRTIVKNWCRDYETLTGHRVLRADIHLDEGHVRDGTAVYNAHAHIIVDRTNERGRVIKLDRGALRNVQSMTAQVTGLRRGKDALETGDAHLSHHAYRALAKTGRLRTQQQVQDADVERSVLLKERDRAQNAEREARAAERAAKAEAKQLYTLLRDVMKASGIAKQQDYQSARQIKADIPKLTDAITFWRKKGGDPPTRHATYSSQNKPGVPHGSAERRPRKRHHVSSVHPFLPGAVALAGRTRAERGYAVRALQKRLLDRDAAGVAVPLSGVVHRRVDAGPRERDNGVRRSTSGGRTSGGRVADTPAQPAASTELDVRELYAELRSAMKASGRARQIDYQTAKQRAADAEWLTAELQKWQRLANEREQEFVKLRERADAAKAESETLRSEREADRAAGRWRRRYRPGFGGQGLSGREAFPFVELRREWDQRALCTAYKAQDGETWFVTTRTRVEVINHADPSLVVALRVAAKKFGNRIEITGPQEFRKRAARLAARLGIEVADADLQHIVEAEKAALARDSVQDYRGPEIEPQAGSESDDDEQEPPPRARSR